MRKLQLLVCTFVLPLMFLSCGGNENSGSTNENSSNGTTTSEEVVSDNSGSSSNQAICMWGTLAIKETPEDKGKYVTNVYLGEKMTLLGETKVDDSSKKKHEYVKVKLTDGTEGWIQLNLIAPNASASVVKGTAKIYKRADLLTGTDKAFERLDFLAVTKEQGDWLEVKGVPAGESWFQSGWIKKENVTNSDIDVTFALLYKRAMDKKDDAEKEKALEELKNNSDLSGSVFAEDLGK